MTSDDFKRELERWETVDLPPHMVENALNRLEEQIIKGIEEQKALIRELEIQLVHSRCWPDGYGEHSVVSRAYMLLGRNKIPIPEDPEPIIESLGANREKLDDMENLLKDIGRLRESLKKAYKKS